ncbi:phosphatase PAP2 family protein [Amycolatopsis pithecellobii]|uniref:phosphatase PAP2 family protein n=1 Tax=Amycolatopsis pithecellobii TaxID=664692 RepID=UPI001408A6B8|nr:phosphatase PAP2 family protein [Amycolatopsis pithecellobii]
MRVGIAVLAALGMVALGLWPPAFLQRGLGDGTHSTLLDILVLPTEPYVLIPVIALIAGFQVLRRRWRETAFCVAATALPLALNTWVLKPLFGHELRGDLAYPSGHTVGLATTLIVLVFLTRQWLLAIIAAAVTAAAGIGLVGLGYHYPVDVLGGACLAVAAVFTLSLVLRPGRARSAGSPHADTSSGNPPAASPE